MPKVTFMPSRQSFEVAAGTTILVSAIQNGLQLRHDCTEAICGTDRVKILAGKEYLERKDRKRGADSGDDERRTRRAVGVRGSSFG